MTFPEILAALATTVFLSLFFILGYFVLATRRLAADAERRVPASGKFADVEGTLIHYDEAGKGRPILFIHGLGGQLHHLRAPLFKPLSNAFHLVAIDRPGSGYSGIPRGTTGRLSEQATLIAELIDELGLKKPLVVGHSLGGAVALALALDHPEKVGGLALVSPLTHLHESVPPEFAPLFIQQPWKRFLLSHTIGVPMALRNAPRTLDFVFGPQVPPPGYAVEGGGLLGLRPSHLNSTIADLVAIQYDLGGYEARYEELSMPVGVMFGTADKVIDPNQNALPLAGRIRDFELELLDGVGHMPQFVETDRVEKFIRRIAAKVFVSPERVAIGQLALG